MVPSWTLAAHNDDYAMLLGRQWKGTNFVRRAKDNMSQAVSENLECPLKEGKPAEEQKPRSYVIATKP
jgi:hypothetical protein